MNCGDCYYMGFTRGTCKARCRHPDVDCELTPLDHGCGCPYWSPNYAVIQPRRRKRYAKEEFANYEKQHLEPWKMPQENAHKRLT